MDRLLCNFILILISVSEYDGSSSNTIIDFINILHEEFVVKLCMSN